MSAKNLDKHNRWRNKTVAFRVSPEEDAQIETAVKLTGLTKQDYIIRRLLCRDVVIQGNPRVYKALRDQLAAVLGELRRIEDGQFLHHRAGSRGADLHALHGAETFRRPCGFPGNRPAGDKDRSGVALRSLRTLGKIKR